jgi:hypothetical protein
MCRRAMVSSTEQRWASPSVRLSPPLACPLQNSGPKQESIVVSMHSRHERADRSHTDTTRAKDDSKETSRGNGMAAAISSLVLQEQALLPTSQQLEDMYRTSCKETSVGAETYRQLRAMAAGEAAQVVRRNMRLSPVNCRQDVSLLRPPASHAQQPILNILDRSSVPARERH